jgi:hypothetical protein
LCWTKLQLPAVEGEKISDRHSQPLGDPVDGFKRWGVSTALNETEEVHRDIKRLRKFFLRHPMLRPNLTQSPPEFLSQRRHLEESSKRKSPVVSLRAPPNEITGITQRKIVQRHADMVIQIELGVIALLLVILIVDFEKSLGEVRGVMRGLQDRVKDIQSAAQLWERTHREPPFIPEPEPTKEEQQKRDEHEQQQLRRRVEVECDGWQKGRIVCRRRTPEMSALEIEYVLSAHGRTYVARGRSFESFYRGEKPQVAETLQLDSEVRCAMPPGFGKTIGQLLIENSEGRILSLQLIEEMVGQSEAESLKP